MHRFCGLAGALAVGTINRRSLLPNEQIPSILGLHIYKYVCMYIVFFRILMYPTNISRLRAEVFPKVFRGLPFPGCKKYSSLKRYPQSWIHDSTSLDPFDPIRLDVTRLNSDPTVEMDLKLRWKDAGFF